MLNSPIVIDKKTNKRYGCYAPKYGSKKWQLPVIRLEID